MTYLAISLVLPYVFDSNQVCWTRDDSLNLIVILLSHLSYFDSFDSCWVKMTHLAISLVLPCVFDSNQVCWTCDDSLHFNSSTFESFELLWLLLSQNDSFGYISGSTLLIWFSQSLLDSGWVPPFIVILLSNLSYFNSFDSCGVKMTHLAISLVLPYRFNSNQVCLTQDDSS